MVYAIYLIVFLIVIFNVRKRVKQSKEDIESAKKILSRQPVKIVNTSKTTGVRRKNVAAKEPYIGMKQGQKYTGSTLRDDRTNDWLARQLREEHTAFKAASDMFGLKIEHAAHCDARLLKNYHHLNCDASGVDTAKGR